MFFKNKTTKVVGVGNGTIKKANGSITNNIYQRVHIGPMFEINV
jgi:hypothetical protein